jgi:hypothetical protein
VKRARPAAWKDELEDDELDVLPLVDGATQGLYPGWCSYPSRFGDSPDVELMCGGVNSKTKDAVGLWRQGNLLHFGFDQGPHELNDVGDALLENAIHYIARFTEDRPIAYTPSVFVLGHSVPRRAAILASLRDEGRPLEWLESSFAPREWERVLELGRAEYAARFEARAARCGLDAELRLEVDEDLVAFDVGNDEPALIERAITALASSGEAAARARRLLARYVPCGPGPEAGAGAWRGWYEAHAPYLFFLETGRFRWYVDPLARARGTPSSALRGSARASAQGKAR